MVVSSCCLLANMVAFTANAEPLRDVIDARIAAGWKSNGVTPAERSTDAEFLRRVSLDVLGIVPTYDEAVAFLDDTDPDKRAKLIDRLLEHPRYAVHQADVWDMVYFGRNPPGYGTDKREGFQNWLAEQFRSNTPYNVWAGKILRAEGNTVEQGAPMFFVQFKRRPEDAIEAVTQKFLGVQLQCARCHDHPFEEWTQLEFYGMAAYYTRLRVVDVGKKNKLTAFAIGEMNRGEVLFTGPVSEQELGKKGTPVKPKFLGGEPFVEPELPEGFEEPRNFPSGKVPPAPKTSRKNALADWVTAADNPYFAKAAANRIWAQFMGKGIVQPVDNLADANPPSHPELLKQLTASLVENEFDLKQFMREILNSKSYQLSSSGPVTDAMPLLYQRARYRPLSAEELLESWMTASGYNDTLKASGKELEGRFRPRGITWDYVRRFFGRPNDGVGNFQGGLHEHLYLNNGQIHQLISKQKGSLYDTVFKSEQPWGKRVERMYLQLLSRRPPPPETEKFVAHLSSDDDPQGRLHEAIWTLMTCSEFRFNH
jgi:hypothetical protein